MAKGKHYFIERRDDGQYAATARGAQRASGLFDTQQKAIVFVKEVNPNDKPDVERVRTTRVGGRDKWRSSES
jgi:hypothetical protein